MVNKFKLFLVMMSIILLASCSSSFQENGLPRKIRIGTIRVANDKTVAHELGLFQKAFEPLGIEVELIFFDSGTSANIAFSSGAIDFAEMGYTNSVVALSRGIEVELIWIHEVLGENEALVTPHNRNIRSIKDLKGKKIATPFASTSHLSLIKALEFNGLSKEDVTLLDMNTVDIVSAWKRDDLDAAYSWEPTLTELKETGNVLITSKELAEKGVTTTNIELVHRKFSKKYPQLVKLYLSVLDQAVKIYKENPTHAIQAAADRLEITYDEAKSQMEGTQWLSLDQEISSAYFGTTENPGNFIDIFYETGVFLNTEKKIRHIPTLSEIESFINTSYIEDLIETGN